MAIHTLPVSLRLPRPIAEVFSFFAKAENLSRITLPALGSRIGTLTPEEMSVGDVALLLVRRRFGESLF
jgi:hypothetical protein